MALAAWCHGGLILKARDGLDVVGGGGQGGDIKGHRRGDWRETGRLKNAAKSRNIFKKRKPEATA